MRKKQKKSRPSVSQKELVKSQGEKQGLSQKKCVFSPETVRDVCLFPTLYCSSAASLEHNDGDEEVRSNLRRKISSFISSSDERDVLSFPSSLTAAERKIIHEVNRLVGVPRYSSLCLWRALSNVVILCMLF